MNIGIYFCVLSLLLEYFLPLIPVTRLHELGVFEVWMSRGRYGFEMEDSDWSRVNISGVNEVLSALIDRNGCDHCAVSDC